MSRVGYAVRTFHGLISTFPIEEINENTKVFVQF
jgi:hypothetical protein